MWTPRSATLRRSAAAVLAAAVLVGCTGAEPPEPPPSPATGGVTTTSPPPTADPAAVAFALDLREVRGDGFDGDLRPSALREPARAIRATLTELYRIGFVEPSAWTGEYPGILSLFAGEARERAEEDLRRLTLGPAAAGLDGLRPRRTSVDVRFLADARDRARVAVADVSFRGVGLDGDERRFLRHEGTYTLRRSNGRWRIVAYRVGTPTVVGGTRASYVPAFPSRDPMFVLVIGSDARPGEAVTRTRADSIHIVGVNPRLGRASVLGIPRDAWVPIPGAGTGKINGALVRGGPELLVQTVERLTGIRIDAYVLTGFEGFEALVGHVRGIDIRIPSPVHDRYAHARFDAGPEHLTANEALALARARHALPDGDFGRSRNQGRILVAALATLRESVRTRGPAAAFPWMIAGARELHTDLTLGEMVDLLLAAPSFDPGRIRNDVATGRVGSAGGQSVVFLDSGAFARFRDLARDGVLGR